MADREDDAVVRRLATLVFVVGVLVSLAAVPRTWHQPIIDAHSFRQTQTALSAHWLARGGPFLAYETPALGAPWSLPFEFPLYQEIVAAVHLCGVPLDGAGRLVSWVFFALTLWQLHGLVQKLGGTRQLGLLVCGLVALSPHYVFWSRAFMIESAALFLSVAFVSAAVGHVQRPAWRTGVAMAVLATLAGLVKITTFVPAGIVAALAVLCDLRDRAHRRDWLRRHAPVALAGALAIVAVAIWTHHCDAIKRDHPFGRMLTSDRLTPWIYGTMAQRASPILWRDVVFGRALDETLGGWIPLVATAGAAVAFGRKALACLAVLFAIYLIPFLIFTNLHWVHNYYQYANALLLPCAVAAVAGYGRAGWRRWIAAGLIALVAVFQLVRLWRVEWPTMIRSKAKTDTMMIREALRDIPDGVVLVWGYDWSPEIAYVVERRAIAVPIWATHEQLESLRDHRLMHAGGLPIAAVVECAQPFRDSPDTAPLYRAIMEDYTRGLTPIVVTPRCTVYR